MGFDTDRMALNHNALKNDVLSRLTDSPAEISQRVDSRRLERLVGMLMRQDKVDDNIRESVRYWRHPRDFDVSVPDAVRRLVRQARALGPYEVKEAIFPSEAEIEGWLGVMEELMVALVSWPPSSTDEQRADLVLRFWRSASALHDFLQDISIDSPQFWTYFKERGHA